MIRTALAAAALALGAAAFQPAQAGIGTQNGLIGANGLQSNNGLLGHNGLQSNNGLDTNNGTDGLVGQPMLRAVVLADGTRVDAPGF